MKKQHDALLEWYDSEGRNLPWRAKSIHESNPYHVWLSEIMLQQTTVATVIPYFLEFIRRWPTFQELSEACIDDILHAWQGLGYYARARNLHFCAKKLVLDYKGKFPETSEELIKLPGIGPYTAKAISAIAFNEQVLPIDGNIARILSRIYAILVPLPEGMSEIQKAANAFTPQIRPGDVAQAMMDLGATICKPKAPLCGRCPFQLTCKSYALGIAAELPLKNKKRARPQKYTVAYILKREDGAILLKRRPEKGLLGGMMGVSTSEWQFKKLKEADIEKEAPFVTKWKSLKKVISHSFTHFDLEIMVCCGNICYKKAETLDGDWVLPHHLSSYALPKLFKKIIEASFK
jgi:A/G-specific adenine glycosylase